ncbi:hypothetical protein [Caloranaerobacter azorensis]|uniref:Uncharacterized protein n=2 Tax=Caloranaerobacter azorensis TaxID=116090 RepID=A0A1M5SHY2_9FIRM|nr:hypothetical protein [Caloranaerobacter azorensis]QIB27667.1 hypothetical protein G3A45_10430 [Caloranaerobacter azorensis]SHH38202.1 hypothetical protein SAMN02745135_00606 [Caloranaerobacter azorensis DSM 13643]
MIIFVLATIVVFVSNYQKKGTFEELVLNTYLDKSQAKGFDAIEMLDISDRKFIYKVSNNINVINEFLSKLNELELVEYRSGMPRNNNNLKTSQKRYAIFLENRETDEKILIHIWTDKCISVTVNTLSITENKENKITKYEYDTKTHTYDIINGSIDFDYLDSLYNSLKELS